MKVLLINSVPLNLGDQALLETTVAGLNHYLGPVKVTVLCHDPVRCKKYLPHFDFHLDYNRTLLRYRRTIKEKSKQILRKILSPFNKHSDFFSPHSLLSSEMQREVYALFEDTDLILSSPGGYLHDFYGYKDRVSVFKMALDLGKPVVLFGQSIGPFWKKENLPALKEVLQRMNLIVVRERFSLAHLEALEINNLQVQVHTDIAFSIRDFYPDLFQEKKPAKIQKIAIVFRPWKDSEETAKLLKKAVAFCQYLLEKYSIQLTFLSTCQGIAAYYDDSQFAKKVLVLLPETLRNRCTIDDAYHDFQTLIKKYSTFDAYIGMRLHGAIFSMLGGTPAMNIGYEDKTKGIYEFLELEQYQIDYTKDHKEWEVVVDHFLDNLWTIQKDLPQRLNRAAKETRKSFLLLQDLSEKIKHR